MRLEGEHAQRRAALLGDAPGLPDQRLMAAMHAVEIADGHDRALIGVRHVAMMTEDAHAGGNQAFGRAGAITSASPSTTVTVSPTLHTQSNSTRRFSAHHFAHGAGGGRPCRRCAPAP